jgi:hypothetical protein
MEGTPCCATSAERRVKRLMIGGNLVGIAHLDEIMNETRAMDLQSEEDVVQMLLKKVKVFNYVPPGATTDYKNALLEEYRRRSSS